MHRAGITGRFFGAHAIRHSVATLIADQRMVQKMQGHQDFGTTDRIYAHHSRGYLEPSVAIVDKTLSGIEPERLVDTRSNDTPERENEPRTGSLNPVSKQ